MRKGLGYLLVLLVLLYGSFLVVQTGAIGPHELPAGRHLIRIGQLDPGQYTSIQEYHTWAYSTCSTAAMTEVAIYYGGSYHITDILAVEIRIGEMRFGYWWPIPPSITGPPSLARVFWRCGPGLWQWPRHREDRRHAGTAS